MGLKNSQDAIWLRLVNGRIGLPADEGEEGAKPVKNRSGETRWFKLYNTLTGYLADIEITQNKFDDEQVVLTLVDDEDGKTTFKLPLRLASSNAMRAISQLLSADLNEPVTIRAQEESFNDITYTGLSFLQGESMLSWHFKSAAKAKEEGLPAERTLPPREEIVVNGKKVFDKTAQIEFLKERVGDLQEKIKGAISPAPPALDAAADAVAPAAKPKADEDVPFELEDDDLPF